MLRFPQIDLTDVRGVLIDIDDTLYPYEPAHRGALEACIDRLVMLPALRETPRERLRSLYRSKREEVVARLGPGGSCRSRMIALQWLLEAEGVAAAWRHAQELEDLYWDVFLTLMRPDPLALAFLRECAKRNLPVCGITDMQARVQALKLATMGLHRLIPWLVTSEEAGVEKPDPQIFLLALRKLGLGADQVVMVGDDWNKDVKAASCLNIRAYQVSFAGN